MKGALFTNTIGMKKLLPALFFLLFLPPVLTGCSVSDMSSLTELSRPYVGEYTCEELRLGEEDMLDRFEYVRLTLGPDGDAQLTWRTMEGGEGETLLHYEMHEGSITLSKAGRMGAYTFPVEQGAIVITHNIIGRMLYAKFRM